MVAWQNKRVCYINYKKRKADFLTGISLFVCWGAKKTVANEQERHTVRSKFTCDGIASLRAS